ncbi:hypothetical protein NL676_036698 [Syzygium grande]|nr:hypothetical protein NL676_036698 [Syzygium grande]
MDPVSRKKGKNTQIKNNNQIRIASDPPEELNTGEEITRQSKNEIDLPPDTNSRDVNSLPPNLIPDAELGLNSSDLLLEANAGLSQDAVQRKKVLSPSPHQTVPLVSNT